MIQKIICFDLDNVICSTKKNFYKNSKPNKKAISLINKLYLKNFYIKIFTARFMGQFKGNKKKIKKIGYTFTKNQLKKWGVKHHELIMFKPSYDFFVDDKAIGFSKNWMTILKKKLKIKI
tara:strand:+ start:70 stop:429 length:360 start_codon:yes stop_codon:yes gene_type:complete